MTSDGVKAPKTARPGDTITIEVGSGATEIVIVIPGNPPVVLPVPTDGRVTFEIPQSTTPGAGAVLITDLDPENPSTTSVDVEK